MSSKGRVFCMVENVHIVRTNERRAEAESAGLRLKPTSVNSIQAGRQTVAEARSRC